MSSRQYAALPDPFAMHRGGVLRGARIAWESWGTLSPAKDNAILLFTGLSPSAHAAASAADPSPGWWDPILGPGLAIDTQRYFVIAVNSLGSCFGSTGPASTNPATGKTYRLDFPELAVEDIANGGYEVLRSLGIERAHTVIGPSLGGMVVLAFAAQHPGVARQLVSISGSIASSPFAIALRSLQREAILADPAWQAGQYAPDAPPRNGLRLARKLGTITYRSAGEWDQRFGRERIPGAPQEANSFAHEFQVESYLEAQAEKFVAAFDANCYLYLSRAMDRFELETLPTACVQRALVIGVTTDILFPIGDQRRIARALERSGAATELVEMPSIEGHDAFLVDIPRFSVAIRDFLRMSSSSP
ncbi:MAG TPA: homoserine O-acetyltransferase [Dokdonella sp.]|nr:homoserine O-acetyltransferase [Dokdonella sp.]HNS27643.1 homoserine O-acetyltransferase [Steroidobacteraceae bacterium]